MQTRSWSGRPTRGFPLFAAILLHLLVGQPSLAAAFEAVDPADLANASPGTVFQRTAITNGSPRGYAGFRILYRSTGLNDEPIAVSGAIFFPEPAQNRVGEAHRRVVAWAHPTTGIATPCAPTLAPEFADTVAGLDLFASKGYVIVATDYAGLGAPGVHPYLIGSSAARAVIDSVRAARTFDDARAGTRFAVWGHSQGGHSALFTGIDAASYAPELELIGVAAAAPATQLLQSFVPPSSSFNGRVMAAFLYTSWSRVFGFPLDRFVKADALANFETVAGNCLQTRAELEKLQRDGNNLMPDYFLSDPAKDPKIFAIFARNTPRELPSGIPVYLAQGTDDSVIEPDATRAYAKVVCAGGAKLTLAMMEGISHMEVAEQSAPAVVQWMDQLFDGEAPTNGC